MKILVTRPRSQANSFAVALQEAGFETIFFPVIEIGSLRNTSLLDNALKNLSSYDWLILTSVNGVEAVWKRMQVLGLGGVPEGIKVAAIGPKTGAALEAHGIVPSFIPDEYVAEAILPGLGDLQGQRVLLCRADIARKALPELIEQAGGKADEIIAYRTLPGHPDSDGIIRLRFGVDVITFTSPSTVHNFVAIVIDAGLDPLNLPGNPKIACIGPITRKAAEENGFTDILVADEYTTDGLVKLLTGL